MAIVVRDPGHVAMRRGIRAAIALPVAIWFTAVVVGDLAAATLAAFGSVGLLITTDFAGTARTRLASYLASGLAGAVVVTIGWAAAAQPVLIVIATAVVGFSVAFIAVMRGSIALAGPAILIIYLVTVSIAGRNDDLASYLLGWGVAVAVSTVTALVVLPRDRRIDVRAAIATCLDAAAGVARVGWDSGAPEAARDAAITEFRASIAALDKEYGGQPFRPSGATSSDRALALLVEHVHTAQLVLASTTASDVDPATGSPVADADLTTVTADALATAATALRNHEGAPSAIPLDAERIRHRTQTEDWARAQQAAGASPAAVADGIRAAHVARMAGLLAEQVVELVRLANDLPNEQLEGLPVPERTWATILRAHLGWHSPWFRTALRCAVALTLAIGIVIAFGVMHGVWVLLGVMSVLRFDSASTRRFAWQAIVGNGIGVLVGSALIRIAGDDETVLWIVLPLMVFLAGWGPTAVNYLVGQIAFSAFVIVMLGIVDWPPDLNLAVIRVEDVAIGSTVAVVVGLLLWPGGAARALVGEVGTAVDACCGYLETVVRGLSQLVPAAEVHDHRKAAATTAMRAAETHDIALIQGGPAAADLPHWARLSGAASLMVRVGDVVTRLGETSDTGRPVLAEQPRLAALVAAAQKHSTATWQTVAERLEDPAAAVEHADGPLRRALLDTGDDSDVEALVVALWVIDWLDHLDRLAARYDGRASRV